MLYGAKMRYSESARKTEYIHMIFIDFHRVSFFSKDLPVAPPPQGRVEKCVSTELRF